MKKLFYVSAMAVVLLSACSNDTELGTSGDNGGNETGLVPVELSMRAPISVVTRGIGTVGDLSENAALNIWRGETLYFNMFVKTKDKEDALEVSKWLKVDESGVEEPIANFDNEPLTVTSSLDASDPTIADVSWTGPKYYPQDGNRHAFFAYHIDDAAIEKDENGKPVINDELNEAGETILQKSVKFVIDGSQDLMVGEADPNASPDAYSAKSARAGLIPRIDMKHLLTRFTFEVVAGDKTADGLEVREVSVVSKTTGRMIIGWNPNQAPDADKKLIWDETVEATDLVLKQRILTDEGDPGYGSALTDMTPVTLAWDAALGDKQVVTPVGEALMVAPGESEYKVRVKTAQALENGDVNIFVSEGTIRVTADGVPATAMPGTSYKVTVKLYGLSKIELTTKLTGWALGEDINVDTATD